MSGGEWWSVVVDGGFITLSAILGISKATLMLFAVGPLRMFSTGHWYPDDMGQCPPPAVSAARTRTVMSQPAQSPVSYRRQVKSTQLPGVSAAVSSTATWK